MRTRLLTTINRIFELFLPRTPLQKKLHAMTPGTFRTKAAPADESPVAFIHPMFAYNDPLVRAAVHLVKYDGDTRVARLFAELLDEELMEIIAERSLFENMNKPVVVPIPLSRKRRRKRGWNQCELIAQYLPEDNYTVSSGILIKPKETKSQTETNSRRERLQNVRGCFNVAFPEEVHGCTVILLDDVTTTGATLKEARSTLKSAGAQSVHAVAIAH